MKKIKQLQFCRSGQLAGLEERLTKGVQESLSLINNRNKNYYKENLNRCLELLKKQKAH